MSSVMRMIGYIVLITDKKKTDPSGTRDCATQGGEIAAETETCMG